MSPHRYAATGSRKALALAAAELAEPLGALFALFFIVLDAFAVQTLFALFFLHLTPLRLQYMLAATGGVMYVSLSFGRKERNVKTI